MAEELQGTAIAALKKGEKVGQNLNLYAGRVMPKSFGELIEYAQMMCKGGLALPKHLRDQPAICMRVIQQSLAWEMDPWAVASKTYSVNDQLAYEAQLIAAVIKKWAPIKERVIPYKFTGTGPELQCSITLHHAETGEVIEYISPKKKEIKVKNSPLWDSDEQQQMSYYSLRALSRRHFSDILMGVYDREEVLAMKDITPAKGDEVKNFLTDTDHPEEENQDQPQDGEVLPPEEKGQTVRVDVVSTSAPMTANGQPIEAGKAYNLNQETGEITEREPEEITPARITENFITTIMNETSAKALRQWHKDNRADIDKLPEESRLLVIREFSAKEQELEEF